MVRTYDASEQRTLQVLDCLVFRSELQSMFEAVAERLEARLTDTNLLAWEPIPLSTYQGNLPDDIRSSWVFVLRGGTTSGAERHPNSRQRVVSYRSSADLQTWDGNQWVSNLLTSDRKARLEHRWLSIPQNEWHRPVMAAENWVVVSFHTVVEQELTEERGDPASEADLRRRTYL